MSAELSTDGIRTTYGRIRGYLRRTPVLETSARDFGLSGQPIVFKLELHQYTGSFKVRGAFANLLTRRVPPGGVVAASGGNHGVAIAYAAQRLSIRARIFVPSVASIAKQDEIRRFEAELIVSGDRYADALAECRRFVSQADVLEVHAYDQPETLLGQGTLGLELEEQLAQFDTLIVAVGGGGLIGGIAAWFAGRIKLIAVEPRAAPTLATALAAGRPVDAEAGGIAADSLAPRRVGELMFPLAQRFVQQVILVDDEAIRAAQRTLWRELRVAAEPGGAAAFAALLSGQYRPKPGERVVVLVCGGNTTAVGFG